MRKSTKDPGCAGVILAAGRPPRPLRFQTLLIEPDDAYRATIVACLALAGCRVNDVQTVPLGLEALKHNRYDLVIWASAAAAAGDRRVTIGELKLRADAPLILLGAGFDDAQLDLEAGADQWLPKPFVPGALVGAVRAALRNAASPVVPIPSQHVIRGMQLDGQQRILSFRGGATSFSRQEWDLLTIFIEHPNRYLTTREILRLGWRGGAYAPEEVRIYIRRLRRKMEPLDLPCSLLARHGQGYCLKFAA